MYTTQAVSLVLYHNAADSYLQTIRFTRLNKANLIYKILIRSWVSVVARATPSRAATIAELFFTESAEEYEFS